MKYDDASWHYDAETFPENTPIENGGVHIALFMKYCFRKGWTGKIHLDGEPEATESMINANSSATEYLFKYCDGKLTDEDLNAQGNEFASKYYGENGLYLSDVSELFPDILYFESETMFDYLSLEELIDKRIADN